MRGLLLPLFISLLIACNSNKQDAPPATPQAEAEKQASFFPVTAYIKGQLKEMSTTTAPLKYNITGDHKDSVWVRPEDLNLEFSEFLTPEIDSVNLVSLFNENKFVDRSYNDAITFTYEPKGELPDTMSLRMWTIYIDPKKNSVQKIFLKKQKGNKDLQLTWQTGKWASIITITNKPDGTSAIEKEEKIIWDFNDQ